jgi:hypothetical protein
MKKAGQTLARRETDVSKSALGAMTYLLGAAGATGAAFVSGGFWVSSPLLQPASAAPMTIPNSTINVNIRFIVCLTFTTSAKRTSRVLSIARPYRPWKVV